MIEYKNNQSKIYKKIILCGDVGVGRTTLAHYYTQHKFNPETRITIGIQFFSKSFLLHDVELIFVFFDLGGCSRWRFIHKDLIKHASGAIFTFDLTRYATLENISQWVEICRTANPELPILMLGTKLDLADETTVEDDYALELKDENNLYDYMQISSKTGENAHIAIHTIFLKVMENESLSKEDNIEWKRALIGETHNFIKFIEENKFKLRTSVKQPSNYHFQWIKDFLKSHKKKKQEEEELSLNEFQFLLRKSKELAERGNKNYSKKYYKTAIEKWERSIKYYKAALKKTTEKKKIKENLIILKESMFNAYKGRANVHNKNAFKAYEKPDLQIAQKEWRLANSNFQAAINLIKVDKLNFSSDKLKKATKNIEIRLKQLGIEMDILDADNELKKARSFQKKDLRKAIKMVNSIIIKFSEAKEKANKNALFKPLSETLEARIINCRRFQHKLQERMDEMIGITPISKRIIVDEINIIDSEIPSVRKEDVKKPILSIIREFEFIGGQLRFKVGLKNNTQYSLTSLKITFDIPKALKWILHEPGYERKGDSILISKLGVNEKKAISLYLEPINCMESPINATISFHDVSDKPHALTMKPKMVLITCPIFFTEGDANLARVKSLRRRLTHHDKKIFPLIKSEESFSIFSSILSVLEKFDIKLTFKDFSEEDRFGEAWFYGITKVKQNQIVIYVLLDGENRKVEIEVSGNDEPQITAFLAEIGDRTRKQLIQNKIIDIEDDFYDMRVSILSKLCPYCYTSISGDRVQKFIDGELIQCKNCNVELKVNEK